jgi:CDP-paratose 2-epimerase
MRILITGGAGFIGSNLARRLLEGGHVVTLFDNLSRPRTQHNLEWLRNLAGDTGGILEFIQADVRDPEALLAAASNTHAIFHLAGQVAVTTSLQDPFNDFAINALGTLNVLEAARRSPSKPAVLYSSTNKVYGAMEDIAIVEEGTRYRYRDLVGGITEAQPLDFHSPYGCSKGSGDQYVRDYARVFGLRTVVFRQSAIYGPRQFGVEDQGWAAHFMIAAQLGRPITVYGNGKQVRDLLYIDDLVELYELALHNVDALAGQIFNVGGGPENTIAIWTEFQPMLRQLAGHSIPSPSYAEWRPGDQAVCVMNIDRVSKALNWHPQVGVEEGLTRLWRWIGENKQLFE